MLHLRNSLTSLLVLAAALVAPSAIAGPKPTLRTAKLAPPAHRIVPGKSVGSPTEGHLVGGAHLETSSYLRVYPAYAAGDARWGLEPLVGMIDHAARTVHKQFPDAVLSVGQLSRQGGGEIDRHASHESGRDADVGFYVRNQQGKTIYAEHMVAFKGDGTAPSWPGAQFDDAKNWALVASIVGDPHAHVSHIFVSSPLRARLLSYAEKIGAPPALRTRAAELMAQPKGSLPHDDHFHVRISCPPGMDKCIEQPLAKKHVHSSGKPALASAAGSHGSAKAHAAPPAHGAHASTSKPAPAAPPAESESKGEASIPSLAPMVQGLDAAVIPRPLAGTQPQTPASGGAGGEKSEDRPAAPSDTPIDDPDGVLETAH